MAVMIPLGAPHRLAVPSLEVYMYRKETPIYS
jgi:hypothetical protein